MIQFVDHCISNFNPCQVICKNPSNSSQLTSHELTEQAKTLPRGKCYKESMFRNGERGALISLLKTRMHVTHLRHIHTGLTQKTQAQSQLNHLKNITMFLYKNQELY